MTDGFAAAVCYTFPLGAGAVDVTRGRAEDPMPEPDRELDARGLACPLPVLRARRMLSEMRTGQRLRVLTTDPASVRDFHAFAKQTGHALVDESEADGGYTFVLKRK